MADNVTIKVIECDKFTWNGTQRKWTDTKKMWDYVGDCHYEMDAEQDLYFLTELFNFTRLLLVVEGFLVEDELLRKQVFNPQELITFTDEMKRKALWKRFWGEYFKWKELAVKIPSKDFAEEPFKVYEDENSYKQMHVTKNFYPYFEMLDECIKRFKIKRTWKELLPILEKITRKFKKQHTQNLGIYDALIRACEAALSNIYIQYGDMTLEDFLARSEAPSGYTTPLQEFKVGEYEYQDALIRILIEATVAQSEPSVSDIIMYVDIPDTDDRGTVVITDTTAATRVHYNKHYYNAPEVSVLVIGGNTGDGILTPNLITVSGEDDAGRYFEVEILNQNGNRTTGTISWVSKGY